MYYKQEAAKIDKAKCDAVMGPLADEDKRYTFSN